MPSNVLKVHSYPTDRGPEVNFTVCVAPLHNRFDDVRRVVETIELDRMLGADRFYVYNHSTGSHLTEVLSGYNADGSDLVRVVPWRVPVKVYAKPPNTCVDLHYYGQVPALQDCLYRNMFKSRYVVFADFDEVIVPRRFEHRDWMTMIEALAATAGRAKKIGGFVFKNTFFRTDWPNDTRVAADVRVASRRITSLLTTQRERKIYPWKWRSKFIVRPELVVAVGIHEVAKVIDDDVGVLDVDEDDGLLHHYRDREGDPPMKNVTDRHMHRYYEEIIWRLVERDRVRYGL